MNLYGSPWETNYGLKAFRGHVVREPSGKTHQVVFFTIRHKPFQSEHGTLKPLMR